MYTLRYKAENKETYLKLATFAASRMGADVNTVPRYLTILVTYHDEDREDYDAINEFLDSEDLLVEVTAAESHPTQSEYETLRKEVEKLQRQKSNVFGYWEKAATERDELKRQLKAIGTLIESLAK